MPLDLRAHSKKKPLKEVFDDMYTKVNVNFQDGGLIVRPLKSTNEALHKRPYPPLLSIQTKFLHH